jgi:hypothetical protein
VSAHVHVRFALSPRTRPLCPVCAGAEGARARLLDNPSLSFGSGSAGGVPCSIEEAKLVGTLEALDMESQQAEGQLYAAASCLRARDRTRSLLLELHTTALHLHLIARRWPQPFFFTHGHSPTARPL